MGRKILFVTTDPARDDPETLRDYLDGYDPDFAGATGEMDQLQETARALAVHFERAHPSGDPSDAGYQPQVSAAGCATDLGPVGC